MADNVVLNPGAGGDTMACDDIAGVKHQRVKLEFGLDGVAQEVDADNALPVSSSSGQVPLILSRFLDTVGNGTGTKNAIGNYAAGLTEFKIVPPAGKIYRIHRMLVSIEDAGAFDTGFYGNGIVLTNGISVKIKNGAGTIATLTDGVPIKTNGGWARVCYDTQLILFGTGNQYMNVRWTFAKSGTPVRLDGDAGEYLVVELNDSFVNLVSHRFMVQGYDETVKT